MNNRENSPASEQVFSLPARKPRRLSGSGAQRIECMSGCVWLSAAGLDIVLQAGEQYRARVRADVVIEALQKDAVVKLTLPQLKREAILG